MSVEADFRALLAGDAGVTALVGTRIAQNAVAQGAPVPYVVFTATHTPELGLDNTVLADQVTITVQCWAKKAADADTLADAVQAALSGDVVVIGRVTGYDEELDLDATVLTVEWWDT